ncbi:MAG TPA: AMP-binding protein [Streptosporangiaceae bacterium]|nr:AMP-binding protein [Streptosporangiaceae bacterium]
MTGSVINQIVAVPPDPGRQISFARLDGVTSIALTELHDRAQRLAAGLRDLGIGPGDRVGILASNSLDWVLLDLAALRLRAVTAGFEPGKFDPDASLLAKYRLSVLFTDRSGPGDRSASIRPMTELADLIGTGEPTGPLPAAGYEPHDVTTIKFTSGSTGEPKGLAATVGSIDSSVNAVQQMFGHGCEDNVFTFLPLSLLQQRYWIYSALCFGHDITVSTYEAAFPALRQVRPTVVMGVPAFYETARKHIEARAARRPGAGGGALRAAATDVFGDRIRYLWTGSAPARPSTLRFFTGLGMPIYEGYGLNETCIVAKNYPGAHREGSVGQVLPGKKVLFDPDGVISVHSEYPVNWRYEYAAPGESRRVFQPDGTVRTGDLGYLDADGFLFIRGRADDVIVLDNGKKIIVRPIEEFLKASPAIEECVVLCPTQTHLVAVVSAAAQPPDAAAIAARLAAANATFSRDERVRDLVIAPEPFSVANGMLTSQFKPRRSEIMTAYLSQPVHHPVKQRNGKAAGDGI